MIIKETFYAVSCDRCNDMSQGDEYNFFIDENTALEESIENEYIEHQGKHYCPDCYTVDEDTDEITIKN